VEPLRFLLLGKRRKGEAHAQCNSKEFFHGFSPLKQDFLDENELQTLTTRAPEIGALVKDNNHNDAVTIKRRVPAQR